MSGGISDDTDKDFKASERLAIDYVLGTLEADARREVERSMRLDPAMARLVEFWELRLLPLAEAVPEKPPPASLWTRIETALEPAARTPARPALRGRLMFWRSAALLSFAAAAALVAVIVYQPALLPPQERFIATLQEPDGGRAWLAWVDPVSGDIVLQAVAPARPVEDRSFELWLVPEQQVPVSLGVLPPRDSVQLSLPHDLAAAVLRQGQLAISLEPPGGSPTGQPTGPVILHGRIFPIRG